MSAAFRLSKKKQTQNDLRKLMNEQKVKNQTEKTTLKIDSPLAKYNETGQLTCILCKSIVRSEDVWKVHINAKQHRENVTLAKQLKVKTENFTVVPVKRTQLPPENNIPEKKIKGILKNSGAQEQSTVPKAKSNTISDKDLPPDFFDTKSNNFNNFRIPAIPVQKTPTKSSEPADELPEGFFDDPIQDAKVRNLEYKDPIEEEWEKFQKEMREEAAVSNAIIAEDQDEATNDRQIDEIDEQMQNWSRVLLLEKKIQEVIVAEKAKSQQMEVDESEEAEVDEDDDFDEFLDWRAKKLK